MNQTERLSLPVYSCVLLCKGNSILLLQRAKTGYLDGYWAIPGGSLDPYETVVNSAVREMQEELNVCINPENLSLAHVLHIYPPVGNSLGFYFVATEWQGDPENVEPHKHSAMQWFELDQLPDKLAPSARQVIEHMLVKEGAQIFLLFWHLFP